MVAARVLGISACLFFMILEPSVLASPGKGPTSSPPAGRSEFEKATRFFEAEEYEAALPLFERAYELSEKRPSTMRALAQCERALKMYSRSLEHFREYLATDPREKASIEETIELLETLEQKALIEAAASAKAQAEEEERRRAEADLLRQAEAERIERESAARQTERTRIDREEKGNEIPVRPMAIPAPPGNSEETQDGPTWFKSPLFLVGAALLVAGGATAAVLLTRNKTDYDFYLK